MKTKINKLSNLFIVLLAIAMVFGSCKKDNNNDDDDTPKSFKSYAGKTDWNKDVSFKTAEIGSDLYLVEYSIHLYDSVNGQIHQSTWAESSTSGIVKISNNQFTLNNENNQVKGNIVDAGSKITGTYIYTYMNGYQQKEVNGTFETNKQ